MHTANPRTILWAVDPFDEDLQPTPDSVARLARLSPGTPLDFVAVHVVAEGERVWETGRAPELPEAQAALDRFLARFPLPGGARWRPRLVAAPGGSRGEEVRLLLDVAAEEEAACIAVSTHGRAGVERVVLGSFAEELVAHSPLPIYFLPHGEQPVATGSAVLFPTDLSAAAHAAFRRFLSLCPLLGNPELVLFHALSYPVPSMDFGLGPMGLGPVLPANFLEEQEGWAKTAGARLVEEAARAGVRARLLLDTKLVPPLGGEAVLETTVREHAGLVVMPSTSGPVSRWLGGSLAQQVFRAGRVPVLLYGPRAIGLAVKAA